MKSNGFLIVAGLVLMLIGALLLLDVLGVANGAALIWPVLFIVAGAAFLSVFLRSRADWWAAIPGGVLVGLGLLAGWSTLAPASAGSWAVPLFFLSIGGGFLAVYLRSAAQWWALIPAGVMWTLALMVAVTAGPGDAFAAAVLFLGLAATFALLSAVPVRTLGGEAGRMRWPLIPATVLGVLGLLFAVQATDFLGEFIGPALLLLAGLLLVFYPLWSRRSGEYAHFSAHPAARSGTSTAPSPAGAPSAPSAPAAAPTAASPTTPTTVAPSPPRRTHARGTHARPAG